MPRAIHRAVTLLTFVLAASAAGQAGFTTSAAPPRSIAHGNATAVWRIDPARSEVRFTVTKLGFEDVTGVFRESDGQFRYSASDPTASSIQWRVRVSSVLTDASNRDRTLQSPEYFDASRHPYLTFESRTIQVRPDGSLNVSGDITIRGVTRGITVHVRPRSSADGLVFETDFELDRYDYGVVGGTFFGRLIGRQVRIHLMAVGVAS
jgi:polyisoprenoid-binding protein YceI